MSRQQIIRAYEQKHNRAFLMPEIERIEQLAVDGQALRINARTPDVRFSWYLHGRYVRIGNALVWTTVSISPGRTHANAIYPHMCEGRIGSFSVVKGSWPDPYALLLANDAVSISSRWLSLIDYDHFRMWFEDLVTAELGEVPTYVDGEAVWSGAGN